MTLAENRVRLQWMLVAREAHGRRSGIDPKQLIADAGGPLERFVTRS